MNQKDILRALNDIDPALIEDIPAQKPRRHPWLAAACVLLVLAVGGLALLQPWTVRRTDLGGITRLYRGAATSPELALIFPWEYQAIDEQYCSMELEGREYHGRCRPISRELLGELLGQCETSGQDVYTETIHTGQFSAYAIRGIDPDMLVAVDLGTDCYVYIREEYTPPASLGDFLDGLSLAATLPLERFSYDKQQEEAAYYTLESPEIAAEIWALLDTCREAPFYEYRDFHQSPETLTFTATSEALGIYKMVFTLTSDGYLHTNILDYGYAWDIGPEAAEKVIALALENSAEAEAVPYSYTLIGTITEICDGYFLVDDSPLALGGRGITFRIPTDDIRIRRWLEFGGIGLGDLVAIHYTGGIRDSTVQGAYSVSKAYLSNGMALIPE